MLGEYPFHEHNNCIEVAQTILDADIPELPNRFSSQFRDFLKQCLHREPERRLPVAYSYLYLTVTILID